ncbi:MAG: tRNA (adenosine(37)-N6)-dimethylallyltransferase MiaA [candidate division WOR-3 bacterium]
MTAQSEGAIRLFCLVGPTASGKTEIAVRVLAPLHGKIVSADARQIYRFLDIGTNKPDADVQRRVPVLMIDLITPEQRYNAMLYARNAELQIKRLLEQDSPFMLVGGSGLYLKALFNPFFEAPQVPSEVRQSLAAIPSSELYQDLQKIDPESARRIHPSDRQRIVRAMELLEMTGQTLSALRNRTGAGALQARLGQSDSGTARTRFEPYYVGLRVSRPELHRRIVERFDRMLSRGLIDEVRELMRMGYDEAAPGLDAIGYREILGYLRGTMTLDQAKFRACQRSLDYAKRQVTWFRHQPHITWIDAEDQERAATEVAHLFRKFLVTNKAPS